ncbi:hypothetical protein F4678DRAFT_467298 [Xylaria arbuscula]|nr:hypothetical protein F4678DRAFT_467298 [Xylaria arbuscula]
MTSPESPAKWFTDSWQPFTLEAYLGGGLRGRAWRFREGPDNEQGQSRRFVVKYGHHAGDLLHLENEIKFAKSLYGQAHIAQLIVDGDDLRKPLAIPHDIPSEHRTFLVTEYLTNSELQRFLSQAACDRRTDAGILLLMPLGSLGVRTVLETPGLFEPTTATHYQIYHGDLSNHLGNLMFGEFDEGEHHLVPVLKAIDFSEATDNVNVMKNRLRRGITADTLTQGNIRSNIGIVMQSIYGHSISHSPARFFRYNRNLDEDIYYLATRCADPDHTKRPGVNELYRIVHNATIRKTGPEHFQGKQFADWESDVKVKQFMDETLLSA